MVASRGWSIITRDRAIARRPAEREAVELHGARLFAITSTEPLNRWGQLETAFSRWRDLERLATLPGPFIYAITRTSYSRLGGEL